MAKGESISLLPCVFTNSSLTDYSNEWTDLVKVMVGAKKQAFIVHRHILLQAPFFEACLRSDCKEARTGVVNLNIGEAEAFGVVLHFLWTKQLKVDQGHDYLTNKNTGGAYVHELSKVYCIGSFLMLETLTNAVIDAALQHSLKWSVGPRTMNLLHAQNLEQSKLAELLLSKKAGSLRRSGPGIFKKEKHQLFLSDYFHRSSERADIVLKALLDEPITFNEKTDPCRWHTHEQTSPCHPDKKEEDEESLMAFSGIFSD